MLAVTKEDIIELKFVEFTTRKAVEVVRYVPGIILNMTDEPL